MYIMGIKKKRKQNKTKNTLDDKIKSTAVIQRKSVSLSLSYELMATQFCEMIAKS